MMMNARGTIQRKDVRRAVPLFPLEDKQEVLTAKARNGTVTAPGGTKGYFVAVCGASAGT